MWRPRVEHDVSYDVVVEGERGLLGKFLYEPDQVAEDLEHFVLLLPRQPFQDVPEEERALFDQAAPDHLRRGRTSAELSSAWANNDLIGNFVNRASFRRNGRVVQQVDDLNDRGAETRREERVRRVQGVAGVPGLTLGLFVVPGD